MKRSFLGKILFIRERSYEKQLSVYESFHSTKPQYFSRNREINAERDPKYNSQNVFC